MGDRALQRFRRRANDTGQIARGVDHRVPGTAPERSQVVLAIAPEVLDFRKQTGVGAAAVEERDRVAAGTRGLDDVASEVERAAEDQEAHGEMLPRSRDEFNVHYAVARIGISCTFGQGGRSPRSRSERFSRGRRSSMSSERDYVLGTHDEEIARLGLQHRLWRPRALEAWRRAGFTAGQTILDVGCGPGYASLDLAEIVGRSGRVLAVDRSRRFLDALEAVRRERGLDQIETHEQDLDAGELPPASGEPMAPGAAGCSPS